MKSRLVWTPLIAYSILIFWESAQSRPPVPDLGFSWQDKFYHFIGYASYGITILIAISQLSLRTSKRILMMFIIGALFAASDELHQAFVPGRSCDLLDWIADCCGLLGSTILLKRIQGFLQ